MESVEASPSQSSPTSAQTDVPEKGKDKLLLIFKLYIQWYYGSKQLVTHRK
jgi:hypothetical protein